MHFFSSISTVARMGLAGLALLFTIAHFAPAAAVPALQIYIEGANYDDEAETWKITSPSNKPLRLWAVGNVAGPGGKGPIFDVKAAFAYSTGAGNVTIDIASSTTGDFGGFTDPSTPTNATHIATHTDGSRPVRADGKKLAKHGVYGSGTVWQEWSLGDFTATDSPIADFVDAFPQAPLEASGQINAYDVSVSGLNEGEWVNIDIYGYILNSKGYVKSRFAPFSHNAAFEVSSFNPSSDPAVPAPGAGLIFAAGFGFLACHRRYKKRA
ncbi:MAG: choice-of-anchor N protein [Alphaproteobacteria bacterium]